MTLVNMPLEEYPPDFTASSKYGPLPSSDRICINVCWTTGSVEYPATFLTIMPRFSQAFTSMMLIPVPASHTSFTFGATPRRSSVTFTLLTTSTSQSFTRSFASSGLDVGHAVRSPHAAIGDSDVSPTVAASRNVIFIVSMLLFIFNCAMETHLRPTIQPTMPSTAQ